MNVKRILPTHIQTCCPNIWITLKQTLADPDQVRRSVRMSAARLFYRWFEDVRQGKYIVVVVVSEAAPSERHWIITAYMTHDVTNGEIEWQKN